MFFGDAARLGARALPLVSEPDRRAAREAPLPRRILRAFLDRGGPIPVEDLVADFQGGSAEAIHQALIRLDDDDLIRIREGHVDLAYPFSASPTAFVVRLADGRE